MEDKNRNQGNQFENQSWEQRRNRRDDDQYNQQSRSNQQGYSDLDRDGFTGNTGGYYGGTSYLGTNYSDWNNNLGQGNYGNQNQGQQSYQNRPYRDEQYYYNQDNPYGNPNYQSMSGQGGNAGYGRGFENQRYADYNRQQGYGRGQDYNRDEDYGRKQDQHGYGAAGNYNRFGGWADNRISREREQRDMNYRNQYGGDWNAAGNQGRQREDRDQGRSWWDRATDKISSWFSDDDDRERRGNQRQQMSGPHRGKGPRGYQRSTDRIRDDINDRLYEDPYVDASEIEVEVNQNEVILKGYVDSRDAKRRAEDVVESIPGVRHVENRLRIGRPDTHVGGSGVYQNVTNQDDTKGKGDTDRDITV